MRAGLSDVGTAWVWRPGGRLARLHRRARALELLAFWVEWRVWLAGLGLIALGIAWHATARMIRRRAGEA